MVWAIRKLKLETLTMKMKPKTIFFKTIANGDVADVLSFLEMRLSFSRCR